MDKQKTCEQKPRYEDRHSCHNISFILGLACAAGTTGRGIAEQAWFAMVTMTTPVQGQLSN